MVIAEKFAPVGVMPSPRHQPTAVAQCLVAGAPEAGKFGFFDFGFDSRSGLGSGIA